MMWSISIRWCAIPPIPAGCSRRSIAAIIFTLHRRAELAYVAGAARLLQPDPPQLRFEEVATGPSSLCPKAESVQRALF